MSTVAITVGGVNVTAIVEYRSAFFESQVNGQVGRCQFRVKDEPRTQALVSGDEITLDIDADRAWTGWAMKIRRVFHLPVIGTTNATRYFLIDGADVNLLLQKRFVFDQATPTNIRGPFYEYAGTPVTDSTALSDLFADWLDLTGDGIDTSTLVEHVGNINVDQDANPFGAGQTWAAALQSIAAIEGAIYYIDPDKKLVYTDVDTPNAAFALSDAPTGGDVGYRSAEVFYDGSELVNDMILWGTGKGADHWVTKRVQDSASQAAHGVWQAGEVRFDLYRQASIDKRANTIVYGSPNNKRGRKDDKISVRCKVKEPGLRVAQKVNFESLVHGYADVVPVRRMRTTFAGPTNPVYELDLSHEIDVPFDFRDPILLDPSGPLPDFDFDLPSLDLVIPGGCTDDICGITDTFTRTVSSGFGTSDSGLAWQGDAANLSVDGTRGVISNSSDFLREGHLIFPPMSVFDVLVKGVLSGGGGLPFLEYSLSDGTAAVFLDFDNAGGAYMASSSGGFNDDSATLSFGADSEHYVRFHVENGTATARIWLVSSAEPGTWTLTVTVAASYMVSEFLLGMDNGTATATAYFDDLDITNVDRCAEFRFDNFNRTVSNGWGTSDWGIAWNLGLGSASSLAVADGYGTLSAGATSSTIRVQNAADVSQVDASDRTINILFRSTIADTPSTPATYRTPLAVSDRVSGTHSEVYIETRTNAPSSRLRVLDSDGVGESVTISYAINTLYLLVIETNYGSGTFRVKIYPAGGADPGWLIDHSITPFTPQPPRLLLQAAWGSLTEDRVTSVNYIDFEYAEKPCYEGGPTAGPSTIETARCFDAAANGGTVYIIAPYSAGTSEVYINGLLQRRNIDYTESNPLAGEITFNQAVLAPDIIRLCAEGPFHGPSPRRT